MELADTSAWTTRFRNPAVRADFERRLLAGAIATCGIVRLELLWMAQDATEFAATRDELEGIEQLPIGPPEWERAVDVFHELARRGPLHHRQVKIPDLLVASAAESAGVGVCHYDRDFELIAQVTGQPVRAIATLGTL